MWRALAAVLGWQVTASICYYTVFAATPFLRDAFGLSRFGVGMVIAAMTLGQLVFLFPAGAAVDGFGEGRTLAVGLFGLALATAAISLAPTIMVVGVAVVGLGIAYAVSMPGTNRAVFESIPSHRRNLGMGIKQVGVTAGSAVSFVGVPLLAVSRFGWRSGFVAAAGLALLVTLAFHRLYEGSGGTGSLALPSLSDSGGGREYLLLVAAGLFLGAALFVTSSYTILYLNEAMGVDVTVAGATLAGMQLLGSGGRIILGGLVDRLPSSDAQAASGILLVQTVAIAGLVFVIATVTGPALAIAGALGLGFFIFGFTGIYFSAIGAVVPDDQVGGASAAPMLALNVGALLAPPAFGLLADGPGYRVGWLAVCLVVVMALLLLAPVYWTVGGDRPEPGS